MRRETVRSLPGMARAERTTVSPGPAATSRCSPMLIIERAESGSPWLPETKTTARSPAPVAIGAGREADGSPESRSSPRSIATSALSTMRRPTKATGRPWRTARSATRCMRGIDVAKQETSDAAAACAQDLLEGGHERVLSPVKPGCSTFVLSESRARTPRSPQARERVDVGPLLGRGAGVDLEVAAREDDARRRLDREGEAVEDAVGDADRMHAEGADLDRAGRGRSVRRSAATPRSCRRLRAKPSVRRLP